ncbi:P-loop containing nucleoside triphosphate hydrolase protein [Xylariomycetidae sp. FL0641]|nr:P-loop containing nucleoside triphosphate hydrolase protein [Xylariomycetidae sp. FL0641]
MAKQTTQAPPPAPTAVPVDGKGGRCEIRAYQETSKNRWEPIADPLGTPGGLDDSAYALVLQRPSPPQETATLHVQSPVIQRALRDVAGAYAPAPSSSSSVALRSPFALLVHWRAELDAYRLRSPAHSAARRHLDLLFAFMASACSPPTCSSTRIAYDDAWTLFRPGDLLYTETALGGEPWLLVCAGTAYRGGCLEVRGTYTDHRGGGEATHVVSIPKREYFPDDDDHDAAPADLPVRPRRLVPLGDALERRVRRRGERFLALRAGGVAGYAGGPAEAWLDDGGGWQPCSEAAGRVVLDGATFDSEQQQVGARRGVRAAGAAGAAGAEPKPWLCPPWTVGFSLGRRRWCRLLVDRVVGDAGWAPSPWDALVLGRGGRGKALLRSLVAAHGSAQGGGRGLVVLLHGAAGTGKTLTAETAAEGRRRALVSVSLGELRRGGAGDMQSGTAAFERQLKRCLRYATIWQAVVLVEEADVLLEAREGNSHDRDALVAIFLRELEHFGGILFLTTSRVETFDQAVKSRIHLSLAYHPPTLEVRRRIWQQYLRAVPSEASEVDPETIPQQLLGPSLNGREIANAVNMARTMARFEGTKLSLGHLETVIEARQTFEESLKSGDSPNPSVEDAQDV